jgi:surfeit locus 1 family protein
MSRRPNLLVLLAALALTLVTARLGWWQLDRAAEKTALQQQLTERSAMPPLRLADLPREASAVEPLVQLPDASIALENRPMAGRVGFYIVTPLVLADGSMVLVQRGWLPRDLQDRTRLAPFVTPAGDVVVGGRIALRVPRLYEFDGEASGMLRQNLDTEAFARERSLPLRPWVVIQDQPLQPQDDGLRREWPAPASGVDKHHGYAFQWFALSALTIGLLVWFQFLRPARRDHAPERPPT